VTRAQLLAAGVDAHRIRRWLADADGGRARGARGLDVRVSKSEGEFRCTTPDVVKVGRSDEPA
jgi:hypothetical protein